MYSTHSHCDQLSTHTIRERRLRIGQRLRELREGCGLTQRELARKVGLECYTIIAQLESGRGDLPSEHYPTWADALGVEPSELARALERGPTAVVVGAPSTVRGSKRGDLGKLQRSGAAGPQKVG